MTCGLISKLKIWKRLFLTPAFEQRHKAVDFAALAALKCPDDIQIAKDIKRTKSPPLLDGVLLNDYQEAVRSVLTAYSNFNPHIGYVQGMNMSVSALLANICPEFAQVRSSAEDAFRLFVWIMDFTQVGEYYRDNMEGIKGLINDLKERIQTFVPAVYWHIIMTDVG